MENTIEIKNTVELLKRSLKKAITYKDYRELVANHVQQGTSSGPTQNEELAHYTLLNDSRMRRLDKTTKVPNAISNRFEKFRGNQTWLVLSESWCGDAAQSLPIINKLAEMNEGIDLKLVLRDENPEMMNAFLTNGSMSIPKLIAIDTNTLEVLGDWGPRPSILKTMVDNFKAENGSLTPLFKQELQVWYNKNKGQNIAEDLAGLLD
ncbi:MAG: thioredoxin family protein [Gammaproteobacteria bacterium]|nr:thioredoxin family protein [Gammaproteobacteria bacterium]